jgi:hypothetical protein
MGRLRRRFFGISAEEAFVFFTSTKGEASMRTRPMSFVFAAALGLAMVGSNEAKAFDLITKNPGLPPTDPNAAYVAQNDAAYPQYSVVLPFPFFHFRFINVVVVPSPGPNGPNEIATFDSTLAGTALVGGTLVPYTLTGPVSVTTFGNFGMVTGAFDELMTSMDLTGTVAGHSVEIMLDPNPNNPSTGSTTVTAIGGGLYDIHSFFDVFTELSIDHGAFAPASGSVLMSLQSIPEPSTWIMLLTAGLIVPSACARWGRRRTRGPVGL